MKKIVVFAIGLSLVVACKKKEEPQPLKVYYVDVNGRNMVEFINVENGVDNVMINNDMYHFKYDTKTKHFTPINNPYHIQGITLSEIQLINTSYYNKDTVMLDRKTNY